MKQIYIHIGLHKTGSTYIQKVCADNRAYLKECGLEYPKLGAEFLFGHHNVAWSLMPGHALKNTDSFSFGQLLDWIDQRAAQRVLISSEDFDFLQPAQIDKLHHLLADYDVKIVMYVRNPMTALYSYWQESVKHGDARSFKAYYEQVLIDLKPVDYCQIATQWTEIFGNDALNVVVYDNLVATQVDIAVYLLRDVLGVAIEPNQLLMPSKKINPSSNVGIIEVIRQLNEIQQKSEGREPLTNAFMAFLNQTQSGQKLRQYLQFRRENSDEFIDLTALEKPFHQLSEKFLLIHREQIKNAEEGKALFAERRCDSRPAVRLADAEALAKRIDIAKLHSLLVS